MSNPVELAKREIQLRILQLQNNMMRSSQKQAFCLKQYQSIRNIMNRSLEGQSTLESKLRFLSRLLQQKRLKQKLKCQKVHAYTQKSQHTQNYTQADQDCIDQNSSNLNDQRSFLEKSIKQNKRRLQKQRILYGISPNSLNNIHLSNFSSIKSTKRHDIPQTNIIRMKSEERCPISQLKNFEISGPFDKENKEKLKVYETSENDKTRQIKQLYSFRSKQNDSIHNNNSKSQLQSSIYKQLDNRKTDNSIYQRTTKPSSSKQNLANCSSANIFNCIQGFSFERQRSILNKKLRESYLRNTSPKDRISSKNSETKNLKYSPEKHSKHMREHKLSQKKISQIYKKIRNRIQSSECMVPKGSFARNGDPTKTILSRYQHQRKQRSQVSNNICARKWNL